MRGHHARAVEVSVEELGRRAAEMRGKRVAKETCEYVAKELFRDIRRIFEKLSLATSRSGNFSPTKEKKKGGEQGSVLPTGEPVAGWDTKRKASHRASKGGEKNPLDSVVPNAGDDDGAWAGVTKSPSPSFTDNVVQAVPASANPEPLLHKRALMASLKEKNNPWYPRANAVKGMRPMMGMRVFELAFLLHPVSLPSISLSLYHLSLSLSLSRYIICDFFLLVVSYQVEAHRGHVTAEEFGIFAVAVHCVIDRYMRVRETLAEIARKREEEKNKFKLEAERRKVKCVFNLFF